MAYRLLIADDSITMQKVVELILSEKGFEIKATTNGEEALAVIPSFKPNIVLADVEMPKINGYQLCEKIKHDPSTSGIPVILLAGAFEPFDEELAKKVRADGFIIKPFESQELIRKIDEVLASSVVEKEEAVGVTEAPGIEKVAAEEDLWAMEEIPETAEVEGLPSEEEEEVGKADIFEAAKEMGIPHEAGPRKAVPPFGEEVVPAEEEEILEVELPSKDEVKEILEETLNSRISSLLSSLDIRETISSSLMPLMRDSVKEILSEIVPDFTEKVLTDTLKASLESLAKEAEEVMMKTIPDLAETIFKDTLRITLESIAKETEKTISETLPDLVRTMLGEELKIFLESLRKEIEKEIWKTIPDLAESIISKEIERIRSEF